MARLPVLGVLTLAAAAVFAAPAQPRDAAGDPVAVFTAHPRLLLRPARLRFLQRERQRGSPRWAQFQQLVTGGAQAPEPGFAQALYFRISGDDSAGRRAIAWALGAADLRQMAFVYDWCQDLLSPAQKSELSARIAQTMAASGQDESLPTMRSRALAAIALYDDVPDAPPRELRRIVRGWWEEKVAPALAGGWNPFSRDAAYALSELFFALRDNANIDLRDACPGAFKNLAVERVMSYYPAAYQTPENRFRIGASAVLREPDFRAAALSRAADMALVALDPDAQQSQFLQGWIMHDNFMLRGPFGAPYEFLWANPYQPGLSYYHLPPAFHDDGLGTLYIRSSWQNDASWFGYFDGVAQTFTNGRPAVLDARSAGPLRLGPATVYLGEAARAFRISPAPGERVFLAGLAPRRAYKVRVDKQKPIEVTSDPGGIVELKLPEGRELAVRVE